MKHLLTALLIGLISCASFAGDQPTDNSVRLAEMVRVHDGDTIVVNIHLGLNTWMKSAPVRLKDVHCFELGTPEGDAEKIVMDRLTMKTGAVFAIQLFGKDKYGRVLGVVFCDGVNLNDEMKKEPQGGR